MILPEPWSLSSLPQATEVIAYTAAGNMPPLRAGRQAHTSTAGGTVLKIAAWTLHHVQWMGPVTCAQTCVTRSTLIFNASSVRASVSLSTYAERHSL